MKPKLSLKVIIALATIYIVWGSTYLAIKFAIVTLPPLMMSGLRYLGASFIFLFVLLWQKPKLPTREQFWNAFLVGALLMTGGTGVMASAQKYVATGVASIGIAAVPLWSCLFAALLGTKPNVQELIGLCIGFVGIMILNSDKALHAQWLGALLLFLAPVFWAFGSMLSRRIKMPKDVWVSTTIQMVSGGLCSLCLGLLLGERISAMPSTASLLGLLYLTIVGSFVGYTLYQYLLVTVRPALATSYAFVNPLVAIFLGLSFAGEHITPTIGAALIVVITGVAFVILGHREK